jgi:hypothetical protein
MYILLAINFLLVMLVTNNIMFISIQSCTYHFLSHCIFFFFNSNGCILPINIMNTKLINHSVFSHSYKFLNLVSEI